MTQEKEINCTYGSNKTPATLFIYKGWYVVEGSVNVNRTHENLTDGVNIETVSDYDCYTSTKPINTLSELVAFIDEE